MPGMQEKQQDQCGAREQAENNNKRRITGNKIGGGLNSIGPVGHTGFYSE